MGNLRARKCSERFIMESPPAVGTPRSLEPQQHPPPPSAPSHESPPRQGPPSLALRSPHDPPLPPLSRPCSGRRGGGRASGLMSTCQSCAGKRCWRRFRPSQARGGGEWGGERRRVKRRSEAQAAREGMREECQRGKREEGEWERRRRSEEVGDATDGKAWREAGGRDDGEAGGGWGIGERRWLN